MTPAGAAQSEPLTSSGKTHRAAPRRLQARSIILSCDDTVVARRDMQGKTLILGLASDVLVSKIDKPDQIESIRKLIKDEFGVDVNIRCMVTNAKGKIPPNVAQDGMVATAIQHGGEIVDMQD